MGHQAVQLGAQFGAFGGVTCTVLVAFEAHRLGEFVELGGGADKAGGAANDKAKKNIFSGQTGNGQLLQKEKVQISRHARPNTVINAITVE